MFPNDTEETRCPNRECHEKAFRVLGSNQELNLYCCCLQDSVFSKFTSHRLKILHHIFKRLETAVNSS